MPDTTIAAPVYDLAHGGHDRTDPRYAEVGYDVIRSTWGGDGTPNVLEVAAVVHGGDRYLDALTMAKGYRDGGAQWGYTAPRYACGCRWIANNLRPVGNHPAPAFRDLA